MGLKTTLKINLFLYSKFKNIYHIQNEPYACAADNKLTTKLDLKINTIFKKLSNITTKYRKYRNNVVCTGRYSLHVFYDYIKLNILISDNGMRCGFYRTYLVKPFTIDQNYKLLITTMLSDQLHVHSSSLPRLQVVNNLSLIHI